MDRDFSVFEHYLRCGDAGHYKTNYALISLSPEHSCWLPHNEEQNCSVKFGSSLITEAAAYEIERIICLFSGICAAPLALQAPWLCTSKPLKLQFIRRTVLPPPK
jgi:hypothetical protein